MSLECVYECIFFFQAEDGIRDKLVTGVQTCALPIYPGARHPQLLGTRDREQEQDEAAGIPGVVLPELAVERRLREGQRSEERRVGKSVDLGGRRIIKKKKKQRARKSGTQMSNNAVE